VRLIAASVVVALAAALLGLFGGGIALATTAGGPGAAVLGGIRPGGAAPTMQPDCNCMTTPAPTPTCTCMRTMTPTPTPTPTATRTPAPRHTPTPTPTATCTGLPTVAPPGTRVPQRADPAPVCSTAPVPFRSSGATRSSMILPVTGADIVPLVAVAALFLIVGAVAFIAGRAGR